MLGTTHTPRVDEGADFLSPTPPVQPPGGPILVASDGSAASDAAFPLARLLAHRSGAAVQVVSALRPNVMPLYGFDGMPYPALPTPDLLTHRGEQVARQLARLVPHAAGPDTAGPDAWPVTVRLGNPITEIVRRAHDLEARVLVVGRGRHGLLERVIDGESVLQLLQVGETPVLAVEPSLTFLPRRVVAAVDFSAFSVYAVQVALTLCAPDATVELVHVAPNLSDQAPVLREFAAGYRTQAAASFRAFIDRVRQPGLAFETTLLEGNASTRLVELLTAKPADLVVSATHGYGFLRRMMLGSVAAELVRSAPCSVLCVPATARTMAEARSEARARHESTRVLATERLDAELAAFTARHRHRPCTVEVHQRDIGVQAIGHHLPLAGVSYEGADGVLTLMFGASTAQGQHLAHRIQACRSVDVVTDAEGREQLLRVHHDAGVVLVQLE